MLQDDPNSDATSIHTTLTTTSISTTATAPNLPGPGRNLGLLLGRLGDGLERFVNNRAEKLASTSASGGRTLGPGLQLVRFNSHVSVDTNATAPNINLPGAGRTVGNLLMTLGKGLERLMIRRAQQIGLGPEAVAKDIHAVYDRMIARTDVYSLPWPGSYYNWRPSDAEAKALTKLSKKLLKYSRAQLLSTQLKALDKITELSIENNFIREVLGNSPLTRYLSPKYTEAELHWASAKAFLSIQEKEVHSVWSHFYHYARGEPPPLGERVTVNFLQNRIKGFLWDANLSFIMARHIQNRLDYFVIPGESNPTLDLWRYHLDVASAHPEIVEWELVDNHFVTHPLLLVWASKSIISIANHMPAFLSEYSTEKAHQRLSRTARNPSKDPTYDNQFLYNFLNELCDSEDLAVQLAHIRNYPEPIRMFLKNIVFGNELFVAHIHFLFHAAKPLFEMSMSLGIPTPITTKGEFPACAVFLHYLVSGSSDEKEIAATLISCAALTNRYYKSSLTTLADLDRDLYKEVPASLWMYNHVPNFGSDTFLRRSQFLELNDFHDKNAMKLEDSLRFPSNSTIWLEVRGDVASFDVTGHYPILAGYTSGDSPKELYVAMVYRQPFSVYYTYVEDGAPAVEYVDEGGEQRAANAFYVMVLRHDLLDVEVPHAGIFKDSTAILETGPVYWTRSMGGGGPSAGLGVLDVLGPVMFMPSLDGEASDEEPGADVGVNRNRDGRAPAKSFGQQVKEIRNALGESC